MAHIQYLSAFNLARKIVCYLSEMKIVKTKQEGHEIDIHANCSIQNKDEKGQGFRIVNFLYDFVLF